MPINSKDATVNDKNETLFNEALKNQYLNGLKEITRQSYKRILTITKNYETILNKDINQFTLQEIEDVLYHFNAANRNTIEAYGRIISSYLNWCVKKRLIAVNVLGALKPDDFEKYLIDKTPYITEKELRKIEEACTNYQDAVIFRLLFIGAAGKAFSEIRNLKKEAIDFENKRIKLTNSLQMDSIGRPVKSTHRYLDVDERTLTLVNGAIEQKHYHKKNGEIAQPERNNVRPYTDLVKNSYVLRASITKTDRYNAPVDKHVLFRRINTITELVGYSYLTSKLIQRSGMLYSASKLMQNGEISLEDIKIIANQFNAASYHNLKGYITAENVRKVYSTPEHL